MCCATFTSRFHAAQPPSPFRVSQECSARVAESRLGAVIEKSSHLVGAFQVRYVIDFYFDEAKAGTCAPARRLPLPVCSAGRARRANSRTLRL